MARRVQRSEVIDYQTYDETRSARRDAVMKRKADRRVHLGEHFTFLFENHDTILYQVQEMMRAERIVKEADIQHEIETYNELLGGEGEVGCTLLIEIDSPAERDVKLRQWRDLPRHVYLKLVDGTRVSANFDPRQVGDDRLSSVQYLTFSVEGRAPVAVGIDFDHFSQEQAFSDSQREALAADLAE